MAQIKCMDLLCEWQFWWVWEGRLRGRPTVDRVDGADRVCGQAFYARLCSSQASRTCLQWTAAAVPARSFHYHLMIAWSVLLGTEGSSSQLCWCRPVLHRAVRILSDHTLKSHFIQSQGDKQKLPPTTCSPSMCPGGSWSLVGR